MAEEKLYEEPTADSQPAPAAEPEPAADPEPEEGTAKDSSRQAKHDEYVAGIAAGIAALVAKGEEVMASLNAQADAADTAFGVTASAVDAAINDFVASMQKQVEKATSQIAQDVDTISKAVDEQYKASRQAPVQKAETDAQASEAAAADSETDSVDDAPCAPQFSEAASAFRERMRVGSGSDLMLTDPEFVERFANFAFDDVPADVDLPDRTRFMCWLATLLGCQGIDEFRALLPAALNMGVEPETIKEIVYQAVAYLGIGRVYPFLKATNEALVAAGVELPLKSQATTLPTEESRYAGGEEAQVACFGEQMRGYKDRGAKDYPHIARWLVKNCFGDWYTRGGLTIAERELCTFCYIAAQGGCEAQLRAHTSGNVHCGNDREFLIKVVSNNVPFIGYPRSLNAMAIVEEVTGAE